MSRGNRPLRVPAFVGRGARFLAVAVAGFVGGALALYVHGVRSGPALHPWHAIALEEEFTAGRAQEVRSLEDYLQLEDRLFAELERKVYAATPTGPGFALARYSAGSLADPRGRDPDWNRTFELPAEPARRGVLLLHGMSDSPYSLRALAQELNRRGHWVLGLRLPGHGTAPSGLVRATWEDMAAAVSLGMEHLARVSPGPIHIVGYSNGAALGVSYTLRALDREGTVPASLVLISPSIGVSPAAALAGWLQRASALPGLEKLAWSPILPEFDPYKYNSFATNAGAQVHRLTRTLARRIETRAASGPIAGFPPTLVFLSAVDATVTAGAVIDVLLEHLAPEGHELVLFDVNRSSVTETVLVADPGPLAARLMAQGQRPFRFTLVTNEGPDSLAVVARHSGVAGQAETAEEPLHASWPPGVISLSHVALPFPPDDPLYGRREHASPGALHLGQMDVQGERGLLVFSSDWLLRLRHNPFYDFLEARAAAWLEPRSQSEP